MQKWWKYSWNTQRCTDSMGKASLSEDHALTCIYIRRKYKKWDFCIDKWLPLKYCIKKVLYFCSFYESFFHIKIYKLQPSYISKYFFHIMWRLPQSEQCCYDTSHTRTRDGYWIHTGLFEPTDNPDMCKSSCSTTSERKRKKRDIHRMYYINNTYKFKIHSWFFLYFLILYIKILIPQGK